MVCGVSKNKRLFVAFSVLFLCVYAILRVELVVQESTMEKFNTYTCFNNPFGFEMREGLGNNYIIPTEA